MGNGSILAPAATLILWTLIVLAWLLVTRSSAFSGAGITLANVPRGARYANVEKDMPERANWVSHNYTHLMEQPTLFYAVVAVLALAGGASPVNVAAAWGYVGLRIAHSLWQGLVNVVAVRAMLFVLSTVCLWVLAINAVRLTLF